MIPVGRSYPRGEVGDQPNSGIVATEILGFLAHWSQIKFAETESGGNRKMALIIKVAEGRTR